MSHSTSTAPERAASICLIGVVALVVGHLDRQLTRRLGHTDAYVHGGRSRTVTAARSRTGTVRQSVTSMAGIVGMRVIDATSRRRPHDRTHDRRAARRVVIVAFDGVQALDVTGPHEVFAGADGVRRRAGGAGYERRRRRRSTPGPVRSESGLQLVAAAARPTATTSTR